MLPMDLYCIRHGTTNLSGTYTGRNDVSLNALGISEIERRAEQLQNISFDLCFSSTARRCQETIKLLGLAKQCHFVGDLQEIDFGQWEGLTFAQIRHTYPQQCQAWINSDDDFRFPGGESIKDFHDRVKNWCDKLRHSQAETVLVVSHGGVIRSVLCHLLHIDRRCGFAFEISEASVTGVRLSQGYGRLFYLTNKVTRQP